MLPHRFVPISLGLTLCSALGLWGLGAGPRAAPGPPALSSEYLSMLFSIPREHAVPGGIYQIFHGARHYPQQLDAARRAIGADPAFVTFYRDLGREYPSTACAAVLERGAVPVISLELHHWGRGASVPRLPAIVVGDYDDYFREYAARAAASRQPALFRFGFEMNGDWFSWGMEPDLYKAAWTRVHRIFVDAGCDNLLWTWSPNAISGPDTPENAMENYWPGAETVDVIGLDGYNFGNQHSEWHSWQSFEDIFGDALDRIASADLGIPVLITEFGCTQDGGAERRAEWIRDAYRYLDGRREVVGAIWFNLDKRREGEKDWRLHADEPTRDAWLATFGRPGVASLNHR